jgi:hypothetical protein
VKGQTGGQTAIQRVPVRLVKQQPWDPASKQARKDAALASLKRLRAEGIAYEKIGRTSLQYVMITAASGHRICFFPHAGHWRWHSFTPMHVRAYTRGTGGIDGMLQFIREQEKAQ